MVGMAVFSWKWEIHYHFIFIWKTRLKNVCYLFYQQFVLNFESLAATHNHVDKITLYLTSRQLFKISYIETNMYGRQLLNEMIFNRMIMFSFTIWINVSSMTAKEVPKAGRHHRHGICCISASEKEDAWNRMLTGTSMLLVLRRLVS